MRGRTLSDAFVIIDEAQNTTTEQMKMVLTRIGLGSKVVVTGDITQIDLPTGRISGLVEAISVLSGTEGVAFCYFDEKDVVRHAGAVDRQATRWNDRAGPLSMARRVLSRVVNRQRQRPVNAPRLRRVLRAAAQALRVRGELALVLAGDGLLRRLNRDYRGKDKATDVLSFPGEGGEAGLGDIVISVARAERNARGLGRTLAQELDVLALHGFLHVLGYDHETTTGRWTGWRAAAPAAAGRA
jgi:rRNA maturation RNase YbeY